MLLVALVSLGVQETLGWRMAMFLPGIMMLAVCYAAGFGVEVFIHGVAATYYVDRFGLTLTTAGIAAGSFGLMTLFARALGIASDRVARPFGLDGRTWLLFTLLVGEGAGLLAFSAMGSVGPAIIVMLMFRLFTHMPCGAIHALHPFIDRKALDGVVPPAVAAAA